MTEEKCSFCEGCGLVKRIQPFCEKENCKNCYLCENNKQDEKFNINIIHSIYNGDGKKLICTV